MNATPPAVSTVLTRVLLVDDDPFDHRMVADLLDSIPDKRFSIETARSLAEGVERLEARRFDICLLDLRLPDGDGLDLLESADALGRALPVIILTDFPSLDRDQRALDLGAAAFLEKSKLDPSMLERAMRYAVHQRKAIDSLVNCAFLDEATGLISPDLFRERLDRAIAFARRRDEEVAVMMIDLGFASEFDVGGKLTDAALAAAGRRLAGDLRETDSLARLSDQRIGLLMEGGHGLDQTATVVRKALRLLRTDIDVRGRSVTLKPSIGIALYPREAGDGRTLIRQAEAAMRRALAEGGIGCRFGSERVDYEAREGMVLEKAFSIAFERRELRLGFYPEIRLKGRLTGLAAEMLWHHPDRGWLPAAPALSGTDDPALIEGIANWSLAGAAEQILAWKREGLTPHRLSLAMPFCRRPALAYMVRAAREQIEPRDVAPGCFELDLREELVLEDTRRGSADLVDLKTTGIRLSLDDFGEGSAAIQHLRHDLLDGLKLASSVCKGLQDVARGAKLAHGLIGLGRHLDLDVTAKVGADRRLVSQLKRLGCASVQFSETFTSMSAEAATAWLRAVAERPGPGAGKPPASPPETLVPGARLRHGDGVSSSAPPDRGR